MRIFVFLLVAVCSALQCAAADRPEPAIHGIPGPLQWQNAPQEWNVQGGTKLSITAGRQTDWFVSPMDGERHDNSPRLLFQAADDFVLGVKVTAQFDTQWNAGVLVVYADENTWAKLCFEKTIEGQPSVVSVVTRRFSDDDNHFAIKGNMVFLKIAKAGQAIFFYASEDGKKWSIVRAFTFGAGTKLRAGFSSQSPVGGGATAVFEEIRYEPKRINVWTGE